jgi:hypothetical protein
METSGVLQMKRIAIVGNGATTRASDGFDGEIWTTGSVAKILPHVDKVFEVHKKGIDISYDADRLNSYGCTIMTDGIYPDIKYSVDLCIDLLVIKYRPMFQFSYDYMMAHALDIGIKDITLYGIDLLTDIEHNEYIKSFLYWIGRAEGSGVSVKVSEGSLILSQDWQYCHRRNYLLERVKERIKFIEGKLEEANNTLDNSATNVDRIKGYREALSDIARMGV